jgi:hypothetical protein
MPILSAKSFTEKLKAMDKNRQPPQEHPEPFDPDDERLYPRTCTFGFITECPLTPQIEPVDKITVPLGQENAFFNNLCDILDTAIAEWKTHFPDYETRDADPRRDEIGHRLNVPAFQENLVYGNANFGREKYGSNPNTPASTNYAECFVWQTFSG